MASMETSIYGNCIEGPQISQRGTKDLLRKIKIRCAVLPQKCKSLSTKTKAFVSRIRFRGTSGTQGDQGRCDHNSDSASRVVEEENVSKPVTEMGDSIKVEKQTPTTTQESQRHGVQQQDICAQEEIGERWSIEASEASSNQGSIEEDATLNGLSEVEMELPSPSCYVTPADDVLSGNLAYQVIEQPLADLRAEMRSSSKETGSQNLYDASLVKCLDATPTGTDVQRSRGEKIDDPVTAKRVQKIGTSTAFRTHSEKSSIKSRLTKLGKRLLQKVRRMMVMASPSALRAVGLRRTRPRRMMVDRLVMVHFRMVILQIAGFVVIVGEEYGDLVYYHALAPVVCWIIRRLVSF